ncbi:hypothetical protein OKW40_003402 [Paraburkholderia sp. RAU6.4a]
MNTLILQLDSMIDWQGRTCGLAVYGVAAPALCRDAIALDGKHGVS